MYMEVHLVKTVHTRRSIEENAYMYTRTLARGKARIGWKIKEFQEYKIPGVNTIVLDHKIEQSNDYLILPKYITGPKWFWFEVLRKA